MEEREDPVAGDAKIVIYSRIDPVTIAALDAIRATMRPKPTRAQLIDAALADYVERHGKNVRLQSNGTLETETPTLSAASEQTLSGGRTELRTPSVQSSSKKHASEQTIEDMTFEKWVEIALKDSLKSLPNLSKAAALAIVGKPVPPVLKKELNRRYRLYLKENVGGNQ